MGGGTPKSCSPLARGTFSGLEAALATLSALEPSWAWCPGRKGGCWAGQDAALRPAKEVVFPAERSVASSSHGGTAQVLALLSPSPTWAGDEDGLISLHVSCHSWMFPTGLYPAGIFPSLLLPGPWERIPAFNIPPSLSAKYYSQGISVYPGSCHPQIPTGTQRDQKLP